MLVLYAEIWDDGTGVLNSWDDKSLVERADLMECAGNRGF